MSCDDTPEWLWKPHSFASSFIFRLASEIVRDCGQMFRGQRWSEKTWPALKLIQITGFFLSDFIKIIWTLHVYGKKCAHSFCATGPNCSHRQKIMPQNVISHREKDWHLCTKKNIFRDIPAGLSVISQHLLWHTELGSSSMLLKWETLWWGPLSTSLSAGHYLEEERVVLWQCLMC